MDVERPRRTSPARGVALIATAVIIGLFILRNGFESPTAGSDSVPEADRETTTTVAAGGTPATGDDGGTDTTEAPASRPPAEVTVIVANTTTVPGAGATMTDTLAGLGYQMAPATNGQPELETTQVQFAPDSEAEARALAQAIQLPPESAQPLAEPPPIETGGSQVVVLLGRDLAAG